MTSRGAQVGVVVRQAEWDLNSYAFRVVRDEVPRQEALQLADRLAELAKVIKLHHSETLDSGTDEM